MADNRPRYLLRNCMLYIDRTSYVGQIGDITPPVPQIKVEEMRNAGMAGPIEVNMGYEKFEWSFKMPGLDPAVMGLFGLAPGAETPFMITGAYVNEDGETHSGVVNLTGFIKQFDGGSLTPGEVGENDYQVAVRYYKVEVDGNPIYEWDGFDFLVRGVSQYQGIRNALLL
jgi:P2 family phage contractile tail tube protein